MKQENDAVGNCEQPEATRRDNKDQIKRIRQKINHVLDYMAEDPYYYRNLRFDVPPINNFYKRMRNGGEEQSYEILEDLLQALLKIAPRVTGPDRVRKFEHFSADESLVNEQCIVCLEDLRVGMEMVRLGCHVSHYLCKICAHAWFEKHNNCPLCNHVFL